MPAWVLHRFDWAVGRYFDDDAKEWRVVLVARSSGDEDLEITLPLNADGARAVAEKLEAEASMIEQLGPQN